MKKISVLGSTGSIGTQTLEVAAIHDDLEITALAANTNIDLLEKQVRRFRPRLACVYDEGRAKELKIRLRDMDVWVAAGMEGLLAAATEPSAELVVGAVVGMIGIRPAIAAIEAGKDLALANKETLVTAGHLIMPLVKEKGVRLLPVDSEHSAIFQCLRGEEGSRIRRILLTASGGPFRGFSREQLAGVTVEDALRHPNWTMGPKITVDSSTMVNKGLEILEAAWLFNVGIDDIEVVVQPQSVIHSMVEFMDGAVMAQLGVPDMRLPIQYALCFPQRRYLPGARLDFAKLAGLTFEKPDMETFRGLYLAREAGKTGGTMPAVFNAANELAVSRFLNREIPFLMIPEMIEAAMCRHTAVQNPDVDEIEAAKRETEDFLRKSEDKF